MKDLNTIKEEKLKEIIFFTTQMKPVSVKRSHKMFNMTFENNTVCSFTIDEILEKLHKIIIEQPLKGGV